MKSLIIILTLFSCVQNTKEKIDLKPTAKHKKQVAFKDTIAIDYRKHKKLLTVLKLLPETAMKSWEWSKENRIKTVEFIKKNNYLIDSTQMYHNITYIRPNTMSIQVIDGIWTLSIYEFNKNHSFIVVNDTVGDGNDIQTLNFINNEIIPLKMINWFDGAGYQLLKSNSQKKCEKLIDDNLLSFSYDFTSKDYIEISSRLTKRVSQDCLKGNTIKYKLNKQKRTFDIIDVYWKPKNEINILNLQKNFIEKNEAQFLNQFPKKFDQFHKYFGWDSVNNKPEKLYKVCNDYIDYWFVLLNNEEYKEYERNIIGICTNGKWEPDGVNYFQDKSIDYIKTKRKYHLINELKDNEAKSVLFFLFDSPHPQFDSDFASNLSASKKIILNELFGATFSDTTTVPKVESNLLDTVLKNLNIKKENCKTDLIVLKEMPNNPKETIVVIPEIINEGEQYFELNSCILIVNTQTGKIKHKYFESSKTNQWVSDAIALREITIDTAPYNVTDSKRAFGIRVRYVGSSQANPYENETISLFIKSENVLKNILRNVVTLNYRGEWDTNCAGEFTSSKSILIMSGGKTNDYYDISVKSKITETIDYEDKNGDCDSKENTTTKKIILKYDGKEYQGKLTLYF